MVPAQVQVIREAIKDLAWSQRIVLSLPSADVLVKINSAISARLALNAATAMSLRSDQRRIRHSVI